MTRARDIANFGDGIATADIGDGQITTAKIADGDVTSAKLFSGFANGITQADVWRLAASKGLSAGSSEDITANLERSDDATFGLIGSGVSESSGIFTFPETGIYLVSVKGVFERANAGTGFCSIDILVSSDSGSNFDTVGNGASAIPDTDSSNTNSAMGAASALVDVTNTSTFQVKFSTFSRSSSVNLKGATAGNLTFFSFIRLGDT